MMQMRTVKPCLSVGLYSKTLFISWFVQSNLVYQLVFTVKPCLSVGFYSQTLFISSADRHIAPLGHIIPIPSQPVFVLSP
jgi:hypothetical protein